MRTTAKIIGGMSLAFGIAAAPPPVAAADQRPVSAGILPAPDVSLQNEVRHAIDTGCRWLKSAQGTNNFWSTTDHPAITALALMALKGRPDAPAEQGAVRKARGFLMGCAKPDGGIYQKDLPSYNTSVSLVAIQMEGDPASREMILKARGFLIGLQNRAGAGGADGAFEGGIGYGVADKHPDLSNTTWALEALYRTRGVARDQNGASGGDLNWKAAVRFIQSCQNLPGHNPLPWASGDPQNKGGFIYAPGNSKAGEVKLPSGRTALRSYGTMSYAGLTSYIYADLKRADPRVTAVMDWLRGNYTLDENPGLGHQGLFYYYHTMAKGLALYGANTIETTDGHSINWREQLALKLINLQKPDGSWANENGRWFEKDAVLTTSYALIALEILHPGL